MRKPTNHGEDATTRTSQPLAVLTGSLGMMALIGCANLSSLQTARVHETGTGQATFGGGLSRIPIFYTNPDTVAKYGEWPLMPYVDMGARFGVYPRLDVGVRYMPIYSLNLDAKYQLYAGKSFALAAGLGLAWMSFPVNDSSGKAHGPDVDREEESQTALTDYIVPLYASYEIGEAFTAYVSPKYVHRRFPAWGFTQNLAGASAGFRIGKKRGAFLELTRMHILNTGLVTNQWSVAYFSRIDIGGEEVEADEQ